MIENQAKVDDFYRKVFELLDTEEQGFQRLVDFYGTESKYCYCFEGIIGLALGCTIGLIHKFPRVTLPENLVANDGRTEFAHILEPSLYIEFLPSRIESNLLINLSDKLELDTNQLNQINKPYFNWYELNDEVRLTFYQFKILIQELYITKHS